MISEARKLHLIEELLKTKSDKVLAEVEAVLKGRKRPTVAEKTFSAHEFSGIVSAEDAALMETAIEEGCEQIHPDDWK